MLTEYTRELTLLVRVRYPLRLTPSLTAMEVMELLEKSLSFSLNFLLRLFPGPPLPSFLFVLFLLAVRYLSQPRIMFP